MKVFVVYIDDLIDLLKQFTLLSKDPKLILPQRTVSAGVTDRRSRGAERAGARELSPVRLQLPRHVAPWDSAHAAPPLRPITNTPAVTT